MRRARVRARRWWMVAMVVVAAALLPAQSRADAQPSRSCTLDPTQGTVERTIGSRRYLLNVPEDLSGPAVPLVISLHGYNVAPDLHEAYSGFSDAADRHGFIVAYPEATPDDSGYLFWDYLHTASPDMEFLLDVVADISADRCVDPDRVHVDGVSLGGMMSQRVACAHPEVFASASAHIASDVSVPWFGAPSEACAPSPRISVFLSCGELDFIAPPDCIPQRTGWAARLGCPPSLPPTTDQYGTYELTTGCDGGAEIWRRTWAWLWHSFPTGDALRQFHAEIYLFFAAHPRP